MKKPAVRQVELVFVGGKLARGVMWCVSATAPRARWKEPSRHHVGRTPGKE